MQGKNSATSSQAVLQVLSVEFRTLRQVVGKGRVRLQNVAYVVVSSEGWDGRFRVPLNLAEKLVKLLDEEGKVV